MITSSHEPTRRTLIHAAAVGAALSAATTMSEADAAPRDRSDTPMQIVDVHTHALLPVWIKAAQAAVAPAPFTILGAPVPEWSEDLHLEMMNAHGISAGVLSWPGGASFLKGPAARALARAMNEEFAAIIRRHPTRFGAFAVLPMDDIDGAVEELIYALDVLHLDGASSSAHVGGDYLGHERFNPLLAELNRRKATLFVHPGPPVGWEAVSLGLSPAILEFMFDTTRMVTNMILSGAKARYPDMRLLSTHGGGTIPYLASRISLLEPQFGAGSGRTVLTSEQVLQQLSTFYFDLTASTAPASMDAIRHLVPASQLMLGFDFPMMLETSVGPALRRFRDYGGLTDAERNQIASGTALTLFPALGLRMAVKTTPA